MLFTEGGMKFLYQPDSLPTVATTPCSDRPWTRVEPNFIEKSNVAIIIRFKVISLQQVHLIVLRREWSQQRKIL